MESSCRAMLGMAGDKEFVALMRLSICIAYAYDARTLYDAPEFVAALVRLKAKSFALVHGDYLHCGLLVQGESFKCAPRAQVFIVICEFVHATSITQEN